MKQYYRFKRKVIELITTWVNRMAMKLHAVHYGTGLRTCGRVLIRNWQGSKGIEIGNDVYINSCRLANQIGGQTRTILAVNEGARLQIGNKVGISNAAIYASISVIIEDEVCIGADCRIYDTDFHSIHLYDRLHGNANVNKAPVVISKGAFIGSSVIILKGVTIGIEAVVAAGSVVTHSVPPREVWGGCPARFIKEICD